MQSRAVRAFKGRLKGYRYWQDRVKGQSELLAYCYDMLGASPRSPKLDGIQCHSPKDIEAEYRVRGEIERIEPLLARARDEVNYIEEILARIEKPLREALIVIYSDGKRMEDEANKLGMATSTLNKQIDKAIEKALSND